MAAAGVELVYRYTAESQAISDGDHARLQLQTSGGIAANPHLFDGWVTQSRPAAMVLLVLGRVARTRFYTPPAMMARIIEAADPIVTADGEQVRFEVFSPCNGVYARLDLTPGALDGAFFAAGTTNVDFGPRMREVLTRIGGRDRMFVSIGPDEVAIASSRGRAVERRVKLPSRWIKGLAEVQLAQSRMDEQASIEGGAVAAFIQSLPAAPSRGQVFLQSVPGGLRLSRSSGDLEAGGIERLRFLRELAFLASRMRVFGPSAGDPATAWALDLPAMRLSVVLSPDATRGFSGEGTVLTGLAAQDGSAQQAAAGRLGYDLHERHYFPRELPFNVDSIEADHPRLRGARRLADEDAVRFLTADEAIVSSSGVEHRVRWAADGAHCTCPWFARHGTRRGPCKHILAAQMHRA